MTPRACAAAFTLVAASACARHRAPGASQTAPIQVAAAADLSFAFREVGAAYERTSGRHVVFSFGATGLLEKQVAEGAPFDVFAAANVTYADDAVHAGACLADSKTLYATGHLAIYTPPGAALRPRSLADLADARYAKIAIANPDHAPYGRAARQALRRAGVWEAVRGRVVYGENVQQALQFAQSGNADAALVALGLALETPGDAARIPTELHDRIDQALVVCRGGKAGADAGRAFVGFVQSSEGRAILRRHGFLLPIDAP